MFSGIVENVGTVRAVRPLEDAREIDLEAPGWTDVLEDGQSVAIDGACLTVVRTRGDVFTVQAVGTTLARTIAGAYEVGTRVNLERALRVGDRLDGHFVQGHVDAVGRTLRATREGDYHLLEFELPGVVAACTVERGSIAVNGVSLTVSEMPSPQTCRIAIIPYTWRHTNLGGLSTGDAVNLEGDLIGKFVGSMLARRTQGGEPGPAATRGTGAG